MAAYNKRAEIYKQKSKFTSIIHTKLIEQCALEKAIVLNKEQKHEDQSKSLDQTTTMFETGTHRLSLVNIGKLTTENLDLFHTEIAIYPLGYVCRKKYEKHNSYKKKTKDKSPNIWEDFVNNIGDVTEYKNLGEFFGFGNSALVNKIEALGISILKKYIPWDKRPRI